MSQDSHSPYLNTEEVLSFLSENGIDITRWTLNRWKNGFAFPYELYSSSSRGNPHVYARSSVKFWLDHCKKFILETSLKKTSQQFINELAAVYEKAIDLHSSPSHETADTQHGEQQKRQEQPNPQTEPQQPEDNVIKPTDEESGVIFKEYSRLITALLALKNEIKYNSYAIPDIINHMDLINQGKANKDVVLFAMAAKNLAEILKKASDNLFDISKAISSIGYRLVYKIPNDSIPFI
jgi:hypothetical protein